MKFLSIDRSISRLRTSFLFPAVVLLASIAVQFVVSAKAPLGTSFERHAGNPLTTIPSYGVGGVVHPIDRSTRLYYGAFGSNPQTGLATSTSPPAWYNSSWTKRKLITIFNTLNPSTLVDYQVRISVNYDSDMKKDFSDLRFTHSDGVTLTPYWIESFTASVSAVAWVKARRVPASGTATVCMYYGNPSANSTSDGAATFELFDDFEKAYSTGWAMKQTMPNPPKADGTAAVHKGKLYVFGGYDQTASDPRFETYEYNPSTNTWTKKANMPTARWGPVAVEFDGNIYVFGGTVNVNEVYDPETDTWLTKGNLPSGFNQGLMGVRCGDKIHLFYWSLHYEYDPVSNRYTQRASMPTWRTWGTCAVVGSKIYVIGGYSHGAISSGAVNVNEVYDPTTDTWTTKTPMPIGKYGVTRENPVINGKIYVTHGRSDGFYNDNFVYDPSTDSWQQQSSATYPRDGVECGVINNRLYVVGGRADFKGPYGLNYSEEYDPSMDIGWIFSDPIKVKRGTSAKYEGNYGLMMNDDTTATEYAEQMHSLPTLALDVWWDMTDALGTAAVQPQGRIVLVDPSMISYGSLYFYNDAGAKFKWYTGTFTTLQSGNWNTWYHVTMIWNGAKSKVIINGVEHSVSAKDAPSSRIRLEASWLEKSKMYFDLVRVRKYSSPEPTTSSGDEESLQYSITFDQRGVGTDFTGTIVTIDSIDYNGLPVSFLWDSGSTHTFSFSSPLAADSAKQYVWTSTTGSTTLQGGTVAITGSGTVTGNYKTQYYLTVDDGGHGTSTGAGWYDDGSNASFSIGPTTVSEGDGTQYAFMGWIGSGAGSYTGSDASHSVTMHNPINETAQWKANLRVQTLISIFTHPSSSLVGFKVDITGTLTDSEDNGISDANIVISYTLPDTSEWVPFISATTDFQGNYRFQWIPQSTGDFVLKAEWIGTQVYAAARVNTTLDMLPYEDRYVFSVASNSTISALTFNSTSQELEFNAAGPPRTTGSTQVTIAKALVADAKKFKVYLDGKPLADSTSSTDDSWILSFTYTHSTHHIMLNLNPPHLRGDVNNDGQVDMIDLSIVAAAFGSKPTDTTWNSAADMDNNGIVNIVDISIVACECGKEV